MRIINEYKENNCSFGNRTSGSRCFSCRGNDTEKTEKKANVKKVKVAYAQNSKPINYTDENGKPAGHDVEIMKLVDGLFNMNLNLFRQLTMICCLAWSKVNTMLALKTPSILKLVPKNIFTLRNF